MHNKYCASALKTDSHYRYVITLLQGVAVSYASSETALSNHFLQQKICNFADQYFDLRSQNKHYFFIFLPIFIFENFTLATSGVILLK